MTLFHTPRLTVRQLQPGDAPAMYTIYGDPEVVRHMDDRLPLPLELCETWIEVSARNYATRGYGLCAVIERDTGELVGCGGVVHSRHQTDAPPEIVYAFRRDRWGRGYASEVVPALLEHEARQHGLAHIWATIDPENLASARVLTKAGMLWQHTRPDPDGHPVSTWVWSPTGAR
jgi:ribosomal-protein-alanine N-acetyltransferase